MVIDNKVTLWIKNDYNIYLIEQAGECFFDW